MPKVPGNYSSCRSRSSENICSSSGGAHEKRKERMKLSLLPKKEKKRKENGAYISKA
jgi:hypothetical protein